jgi:protein phosphatase
MRIHAAGFSDIGNSRAKNDDYYCLGSFVEQGNLTTLAFSDTSSAYRDYGLLAAVADGMGGYPGGDVASRVVLETLSAVFHGERRTGCSLEELQACMARYLEQTQRALLGILDRTADLRDAGTTLAGVACMPPDAAVIFHCGDSRVLRASAGYVRPLTVDHSVVGADVASGRMTEDEAAGEPSGLYLTRSLSRQGNAQCEVQGETTAVTGNQFFIGTDGWHGLGRGLTRSAIQQIAREGLPAEAMLQRLLNAALATQTPDNATLVVVQYVGE